MKKTRRKGTIIVKGEFEKPSQEAKRSSLTNSNTKRSQNNADSREEILQKREQIVSREKS